ncbi:MAG TPA: serine/threonine-protein kinase, partial [Pseudomonadota bacterium]|nr:serine/threonine-protein kinase [Pseudomonadota bacterium]
EIVHRDVSPHNILISFSGDVKISDFGIAKVAERASAQSTGTVKGKLAYMSPEQITGQPLDGRTDIYSMGIVFWELLTRHRLFFGPDEHDVIRRVRDGIVPSPRQYNQDLPEEVEKIVMKMLVANRSQRYQSAGEVVRALCALPQYNYDAQALGEYMRALFPEETRNWTQVLQTLLATPGKATKGVDPSGLMPVKAKAPSAAAPPVSSEAEAEGASEPPAPGPAAATMLPGAISAAALMPAKAPPPVGPPPPPPKGSDPGKAASQAPTPPTNATAQAPSATSQPASPARPPPPPPPTRHLPQPASPDSEPAPNPPAPGSPMAGSEQKTQIATEMPPEVANALANQGTPGSAGAPPPAAPPAAAGGAAAGARTMIASAPSLPSPPPPGAPPAADAGARTMMATAPAVPALGGGQATLIAGPGGAPPGMGGATPNAAGFNNNGPASSPGGRVAHLALKPASAMFSAAPQSGNVLATGKWVIGPVVALVVMLITAAVANRIWPPATGSGGGGPSFLAAKRAIQIASEPPGAEVQVDGLVLDEKTPTSVKGEIGKTARIRISLPGYDPHEVTLSFTQDARPPYKVKLFKAGTKQKSLDPSTFDERPDVSKPDEDDDGKKPTGKDDGKKAVADKDEKKDEKTDKKDEKVEKTDKKDGKKKDGEEEDEDGGKKKKGKKEGDAAKKGKATLTILVRPWAIVYVDGKKLQQTPLRNYPISAGAHKILLVNDTKGKREEIKLKVNAGEAVPEIKRTWE